MTDEEKTSDGINRAVVEDLEMIDDLERALDLIVNGASAKPEDYGIVVNREVNSEIKDPRRAMVYQNVLFLMRTVYEHGLNKRKQDFEGLDLILKKKMREYDHRLPD